MKSTKEIYEKYPYPLKENLELSKNINWSWLDKLFNEKLKYSVDNFKGLKVLDAGCGTGEKSLWLKSKGAIVIGIDQSFNSIIYAINLDNEILFMKLSIEDLNKIRNLKYDFIFCYGVLHHTEDLHKSFAILCNKLNKGGYIFLNVYSKWAWKFRDNYRINKMLIKKYPDDLEKRKKEAMEIIKSSAWRKFGNKEENYYVDTYCNFQTIHSIGELIKMYNENGITVTGIYPNRFGDNKNILSRSLNQLEQAIRHETNSDINIVGVKK